MVYDPPVNISSIYPKDIPEGVAPDKDGNLVWANGGRGRPKMWKSVKQLMLDDFKATTGMDGKYNDDGALVPVTDFQECEEALDRLEDSLDLPDTVDIVEMAKSGIPGLMRRAIVLAARSKKVHEVMSVLKELNDRAYGKAVQGHIHAGKLDVEHTIADVLKSIDGTTSGLPKFNKTEDIIDVE